MLKKSINSAILFGIHVNAVVNLINTQNKVSPT
jgi:hypothetical protein